MGNQSEIHRLTATVFENIREMDEKLTSPNEQTGVINFAYLGIRMENMFRLVREIDALREAGQ